MRKTFDYGVGGVLSADIAVPEHERELTFYSAILTTGDSPLWREDLMNNLGTPVIGLGVRTPEYENLPLQWMPHFQVRDVAASVTEAIHMGGKELVHSKADDGQCQWAVLSDPVGAAFGIIPIVACESDVARESDSSGQNERLGCISWLSLWVPNAAASRDFYQRVVGWNAKSIEKEKGAGRFAGFEMQRDHEIAAAAIWQDRSDDEDIPSVWLIHLPVDDLVESLRRVSEGGGEVIREYAEAKYAIVRDPIGVYLALQAGP